MRTALQEWELAPAYIGASYRAAVAGRPLTFTFSRSAGDALAAADVPRGPWAIVAAANPYSVALGDEENAARTRRMRDQLRAAGARWSPACNAAPDGAWAEEAFLVENLSREDALLLCRGFGQAAAVFAVGGKVGLLWTRSDRWVVLPARRALDGA